MRHMFSPTSRNPYKQTTKDLSLQVAARGICVNSPSPDDWFPPESSLRSSESSARGTAFRTRYEQIARELCGPCPVRTRCLELVLREEHHLSWSQIYGIRGGKAPWQRYPMILRRRRRAARNAARQARRSVMNSTAVA